MKARSAAWRIGSICLAFIICGTAVAIAQQWSSWTSAVGDVSVDYRWRGGGMCIATGCGKDMQFRNISSSDVSFDYTIWAVSMADKNEEVQHRGSLALRAESTHTFSFVIGADVTRVTARRRR
jgi:hypothetical protein